MVSSIKIQAISELNYNYSISYLSNNDFSLILLPTVSFPKRLKLSIQFKIINSLINDDSFYLTEDSASITLKIY